MVVVLGVVTFWECTYLDIWSWRRLPDALIISWAWACVRWMVSTSPIDKISSPWLSPVDAIEPGDTWNCTQIIENLKEYFKIEPWMSMCHVCVIRSDDHWAYRITDNNAIPLHTQTYRSYCPHTAVSRSVTMLVCPNGYVCTRTGLCFPFLSVHQHSPPKHIFAIVELFNLHTTVKNNSHFYLHRGPMDPKY